MSRLVISDHDRTYWCEVEDCISSTAPLTVGLRAGHEGPHNEEFRDTSNDCRRCGARDSYCEGTCGDT